MKHALTLLALVTAVAAFTSCKKESEIDKPAIADIEFTLYDLRAIGDTSDSDVPYSNTLILKSDYTWTVELGGAKSNGTYTWTPIENQQSTVKFFITTWTDFTTDQVLSDKLKSVLLSVNYCGYSLQDPSFANFLARNYPDIRFPFMRTKRK